ncbi:MAG: flippase-like domain-containing protein [Saprospiraceae bacterium]|nr:flippase-like domain-containing protein [Saprospiraceae bacterium]
MPTKPILNLLAKLLITGLLAWAIYRQVFAKQQAEELWAAFVQHFTYPNMAWLLAVVALAPLNLALEALKWRELTRSFSKMNFWRSFKAVVAGSTIGIFTPNRVGEYGGRLLFVEEGQGWKAVISTMVGSLAQLLVLLAVGLVGALYFLLVKMEFEAQYLFWVAVSLASALVGLLFFTYFNIDLMVVLAKRVPYVERFRNQLRHLTVLRNYHRRELGRALWYAFLRYATFTTQYYLLLQFYGVPAPWLMGMAGIATIFLVQASVPLPPAMGLLARSEIALFVWGFFTDDRVDILAATFSLFVINIVVPALLGLVFIIQVNILKSIGLEDKTSS